jgi:nicotinamidase-related amidase
MTIPKKRYSAFFGTDLDKVLRSRGIRDLIISGVMTNLCCETTARDAFMKDYRVFFLIDGTATRRSELHLATLKNLGFGFAYLLTCDELIQKLKASS